MKSYSLSHLADQTLLRDLAALLAHDRATTASLLAHLAEIDARKLYLPAGYPSMFAYCVEELHLSEQAAFTRIRAARVAREFPAVFDAVAEGRLHLSAVVLLSPFLSAVNAAELLAAAKHKSKAEIEQFLAQRFPRPDVPLRVRSLSSPAAERLAGRAGGLLLPAAERQLFPGIVEPSINPPGEPRPAETVPDSETSWTESSGDRARVHPLAPRRFALQLTMSHELHDKLRYAQRLLSHQFPSGDVAGGLERALDLAIPRLEKSKFGATERPRPVGPAATAGERHVPAHVKRAVWERDGGRCTFVSAAGRRCSAHERLEFDHIDEVARGGRASVSRMRLRCRAHNQFGAERTFGVEFMRRKRDESRRMVAATQPRRAAEAQARRERARKERCEEVIPWLRALGFKNEEARRATAAVDPRASLEQRVRAAVSSLAPRAVGRGRPI